jgi:hypothetical protein
MTDRTTPMSRATTWVVALCLVLVVAASVALVIGTNAFAEDKNKQTAEPVRITKGPVIEFVSDHSAVIAWSTDVDAGSVLHYGPSDRQLTEIAESKYGGRTHRVHLVNLRPNTTYYFQVESPHAQGTGGDVKGHVESFHTPAKGQKGEHYPSAGPGL